MAGVGVGAGACVAGADFDVGLPDLAPCEESSSEDDSSSDSVTPERFESAESMPDVEVVGLSLLLVVVGPVVLAEGALVAVYPARAPVSARLDRANPTKCLRDFARRAAREVNAEFVIHPQWRRAHHGDLSPRSNQGQMRL